MEVPGTPRIARFARPTRVPAGATSIMPATSRSSRVAMHRSQRTGLVTWETRVSTNSSPDATAEPSRLVSSAEVGSETCRDAANSSSAGTAGAIASVWNAPATFRGMTRARAGGFAANASMAGMGPAATIWPPPLEFAATRPAASMASRTFSSTPPSTAAMPVGEAPCRWRARARNALRLRR